MLRLKSLKGRFFAVLAAAGLFAACTVTGADAAGITVYKDGPKYVKMGGRIQLQYHQQDPKTGSTTDELKFRRLRPYIEGSLHKDWTGKFQWDMGDATGDNEIAIKDAYLRYSGFKNMKITVGNAFFQFSREVLTSSKYQQLVERTFVGDHNYGTPDRLAGVHITGSLAEKKVTYGISLASGSIDPDKDKLDFDTPVNKSSDFNEGWIVGGRVDFHPLGPVKFSQGDFKGITRVAIGVAAFTWSNDDDNNTYTNTAGSDTSGGAKPDVDRITGFEVSGAFRARGVSIDAQYNSFDAETVDPTVTSGIWKNGDTTLENYSIEGGYMVVPNRLELVAGYQVQDADNYATEWKRTSIGANYFFEKHDIKTQVTYRMGEDLKGVKGSDEDELFIQMQYVF